MEKIISSFNLKDSIKKGKSLINISCPDCLFKNEVIITTKHNYNKIKIIECKNCGKLIEIGDIYNFKHFKGLNNRLDSRYDSEVYIANEWHQKYNEI